MATASRGKRLFGVALSNWEAVLPVLKWVFPPSAGALLMGWAAQAYETANHYSPLSWATAALIGALLAAGIMALIGYARNQFLLLTVRRRFYQDVSERINPLEPVFRHQRIRITDLLPPLGQIISGKSFIDCQLVGPANVVLIGDTQMAGTKGDAVDAVVTRDDSRAWNAAVFLGCTFRNCSFFNVTFLVSDSYAPAFAADFPGLNWITRMPGEPEQLKLQHSADDAPLASTPAPSKDLSELLGKIVHPDARPQE